MSQAPQNGASSRYKISNPQPYQNPDNRFPPDSTAFQIPPSSRQQYGDPNAIRSASPAFRQNGETSRSTPAGSSSQTIPSPARPARSRMRDQAPVQAMSPPEPLRPQRAPRPTIKTDTRQPSYTNSAAARGYEITSPVSPDDPSNTATQFNDPFAADRSQRVELRDQTREVARQASTPLSAGVTPVGYSGGAAKLRQVVGAFQTAGQGKAPPPAKRPGKSEARTRAARDAAKEQEEQIWNVDDGGKFGELDGVLRKIKTDWPFVMESDFSPSTLALSLLSQIPSTSLPQHPNLPNFLRLHDSLSSALQGAVQAHFQSFAASLPAHATFLTTLGRAQEQVKTSKEALKEARDGFAGKGKGELAGVRARERTVRDMLTVLDTIDQLKQIPEQLEALIGDKKFYQAAITLVRGLKTINKPEIAQIGAVSDLKQYLTSQETTLMDILIEELQSHLYLKTYYSDSRWKSYTEGQQTLPIIDLQEESSTALPRDSVASLSSPNPAEAGANGRHTARTSSRFSRYLSTLAVKPAPDPMMDLNNSDLSKTSVPATVSHSRAGSSNMSQAPSAMSLASLAGQGSGINNISNPEADSLAYMETILEALAALGRLGGALETLSQRVSGETHALIEATLDEVEERAERRRDNELSNDIPQSAQNESFDPSASSGLGRRMSLLAPTNTSLKSAVSLDAMGPPRHAAVLRDLFWTLYSKLAAVIEGHRAIYEISRWISSRRDFRDLSTTKPNQTLTIPVQEVWRPVQQEVRNLLRNYLSDDDDGSALDRHQVATINEVLRDGKLVRDRQRQMFRFNDTDNRSVNNEIKVIDDSIQQALKASVPGLVSMQSGEGAGSGQQSVLQGSLAGSEDRYSASAKHRTLIPPNAFNVTTLFQPTLAFIERASAIIPPGFEHETGAFSGVLEEFVVKVFLPQLDEKVTASFQHAVSGYDAYEVDRQLITEFEKPPLKSSVRVMTLIHNLCVMLQTTPFHRENYSRLIIGVIVQYYQQCSTRFKELATLKPPPGSLAEGSLALPAIWAQREDFTAVLTELRAVIPADRAEVANIAYREVKLETELLGSKPVVESQLINSQRKLESLGHLAESLRWFIDSLLEIQDISEDVLSPMNEHPTESLSSVPAMIAYQPGDPPKLPLTRAMNQRYEAIVQTYEQLAEMVMNTMRLEIRCRIMCNLAASLQKGDFRLETEALEPDSDVVDLNANLVESDEIASKTLSVEDKSFMFRGLGHLVDHMFIHSARSMKSVNSAGVKKIKRDNMALQQSLRAINQFPHDAVLERSIAYWDMYDRGPKAMLESIRTAKPLFGFEDYNTMLNLQCRTDPNAPASSELNTYLIDLHALSMSIDGWEIGEN